MMEQINDSAYPRRGYWEPDEPDAPTCPVCKEEASLFFLQDGEIVGCGACIHMENAFDYERQRQEDARYNAAGV